MTPGWTVVTAAAAHPERKRFLSLDEPRLENQVFGSRRDEFCPSGGAADDAECGAVLTA
jgi:hypothetical protein